MSVVVRRQERPEGGHLARLTIDNAGKLNSLNRALMSEITEAAGALATDPELRLVVKFKQMVPIGSERFRGISTW